MVAAPQDVPSVKSVKSVVIGRESMRPCDGEARGDLRPKGRAALSRSHSAKPPALPELADSTVVISQSLPNIRSAGAGDAQGRNTPQAMQGNACPANVVTGNAHQNTAWEYSP